MEKGKQVSWMAVNGIRSGVIIGPHQKGYFVRLESGKQVIVHPKSFIL